MRDMEIVEALQASDISALEEAMNADTRALEQPVYQEKPLGIFQRDNHGEIVAGLIGKFVWDWLYIDMLWVDAALRHQGIGRKLMLAAESEAQARRCNGIYLWTQSFQAPDFYQKLGYQVFVQFPDFPTGHQRIGLMKNFSARK